MERGRGEGRCEVVRGGGWGVSQRKPGRALAVLFSYPDSGEVGPDLPLFTCAFVEMSFRKVKASCTPFMLHFISQLLRI